jgi:hypothetical protein
LTEVNRPIGIALATAFGVLALLFAVGGLLLGHDQAAASTVQNGPASQAQETARPGLSSDHPAAVAPQDVTPGGSRAPLARTLAGGALFLGALASIAIIALGGSVLRQPSGEWTVSTRNPEAPSRGAGWGA